MIDIHCHILPGVDDGADDLPQALAMCRQALRDGCEALVATPHQRHPVGWATPRRQLERLLDQLSAELGGAPRLLAGGEIYVDSELLNEIDRLPGGELLPLAGSRYLLLELDRRYTFVDPLEVFHEIQLAGWQPILAHPEHYPWLVDDPELLHGIVSQGTLLQVTAGSLLGTAGRRVQQAAVQIMDAGWVHFVASDAHNLSTRQPGLAGAAALIAERWGRSTAERLTRENPAAVLENLPLPSLVQA